MSARANDAVFDRTEVGQRRSIRQVAFASFIGTAVEWYDFIVYGTVAVLVFPKLFFREFSPLAGTLNDAYE
jgi:MFS transporter, MHS family, shikimate and dehydroshikimate transport protein